MRVLNACPACDSSIFRIVVELDAGRRERFLDYSKKKYGGLLAEWIEDIPPVILCCEKCGHCWYQYQPDDDQLALMYASGRRLLPDVQLSREPTSHMLHEMRRLRRLFKETQPCLLDYGSGYGRWARAAATVGFLVTAYEPTLERGSEEGGHNFEILHDVSLIQGRKFHVVNLEQVLEHVSNPLETLRFIRNFCSKKSIIRITVPNVTRAFEGKRIWYDWPYDNKHVHTMAPFEHLHGFTALSLNSVVKYAGFSPVFLRDCCIFDPVYAIKTFLGKMVPLLSQTKMYLKLS